MTDENGRLSGLKKEGNYSMQKTRKIAIILIVRIR